MNYSMESFHVDLERFTRESIATPDLLYDHVCKDVSSIRSRLYAASSRYCGSLSHFERGPVYENLAKRLRNAPRVACRVKRM